MARYLTAQDEHTRMRWRTYLCGFVPTDVSVPQLDAELRRAELRRSQRSEKNARRDAIAMYLAGKRTVTYDRAFEIGEALQTLGCRRTNGVMAMYAAGHYATCVALIGRLAERGRDHAPKGGRQVRGTQAGISLAIDLHALLPLAVHFEVDAGLDNISAEDALAFEEFAPREDPYLSTKLRSTFESARHGCVVAGNSSRVHEAWADLRREGNPLRGVHSTVLHAAYHAAQSKVDPVVARDLAWHVLDFWIERIQHVEQFPAKGASELRMRAREVYKKWSLTNTREKRDQARRELPARDTLPEDERIDRARQEKSDATFARLARDDAVVERSDIDRELKKDAI